MGDRQDYARDLFNDALDRTPRSRAQFLDDACHGDAALRREVESLLAAWHDGGPFLEPRIDASTELGDVGPFELRGELGRGGQAVVYRARDRRTGGDVALKVLSIPLQRRDDAVARFLREARSAARLEHPGLCRVFECGDAGGVLYFSMELIEGETLQDRIAAARQAHRSEPIDEVLKRFVRIAEALQFAHESGLVHRDIKPGNIMLRADGTPAVLDFGLVRDLEQSGASMTRSADVLGTPYYLAPEQLATDHTSVDSRADVYALAVTLYECLTRTRPFDAATRDGLYRRILGGGAPDPRRFEPSIPRDLCVVLETAMEVDPARRYATARDFAEDLRHVLLRRPIRARRASSWQRTRQWAQRHPVLATATGGVFVAVAGALVVALVMLADVAAERDRVRIEALVRASAEVARTDPQLGLQLAFEAARREQNVTTSSQLHRALAASRERAVLRPSGGKVRFACFAPNGQRVVTQTAGFVELWNTSGDRIASHELSRTGPIAFAPDGSAFVVPCADHTARVIAVDGTERRVLRGHTAAVTGAAFSLEKTATVSRDGSLRIWPADGDPVVCSHDAAVLCVAGTPNGGFVTGSVDGVVRRWSATGEPLETFSQHERPVTEVDVSPNGAVVSRDSSAVWLWDEGEARALPAAKDFFNSVEFSPDGSRVLTSCADHTLSVWSTEAQLLARMRGHEAPVEIARFAPDGRRVISGSSDLTARVWDADGDAAFELRGHGSAIVAASFSPDGRMLLTGSDDRTVRLWNPNPPELPVLRGHDLGLYDAKPLGDGGAFVTASRDRTARIWTDPDSTDRELRGHGGMVFSASPVDGGETVMTTGYDQTIRFWNRDGQQIGFLQNATGRFFDSIDPSGELLLARHHNRSIRIVRRSDGSERSRLEGHTDMIWWAEFAPRGDAVVTASADGTARVWSLDGACTIVMDKHEDRVRSATFSRTGQRIVTTSDDGTARVWNHAGDCVAVLRGHRAEVLQAEFSPDESRIVTASRDTTARLWSVDGCPLLEYRGHTGVVWSARFTDQGRRVVTASSDRTARFWITEPSELLAIASRHTRELTAEEREKFGALLGGR